MYAIKRLARTILKPSQPLPYHEAHAQQAYEICKTIESKRGPLSRKVARECDDYATEILGDKKYAPWFYVYSMIAGHFKEGWIPDNFYGANVIPKIKGHYGNFANLKPLNIAFFQTTAFPDQGSFVNGLFLDEAYNVVTPNVFKRMLFEKCDRTVFKTDRSCNGRGLHFFDKYSFSIEAITRLGNGVFQRYIDQYPLFNEYTPNSVATLRITTFLGELGTASVRAAYLRFGTGGDTHVQPSTSVRVPLDLATGVFSDVGYLGSWLTTPVHPTSRRSFANECMPNYSKCVDLVTSLHQKVPYVRCIGWDLALDAEGEVVVLEWNGAHNDIKFAEATQGPCFADLGWERFR